jgi:hypothetical protein
MRVNFTDTRTRCSGQQNALKNGLIPLSYGMAVTVFQEKRKKVTGPLQNRGDILLFFRLGY